ncbi:RHS domain-containing protein [Methylomonas sp. MgM2]
MKWNPGNDVSNPGFRSAPSRLRLLGMIYTSDQRLSRLLQNPQGGLYDYDTFGRRVNKIANKKWKMFAYDGSCVIGEEGFVTMLQTIDIGSIRYAYLDGEPLARIDEPKDGDRQIRYYHNNHLGAPLKVTDQQGQVVWAADYDPFGKATVTNATITQNLIARPIL